jgi:hypothetical protein
MADRRMFSKTIIDSDAFLDMPLSTQALYFHLSMRADDEGFVGNPRKVMRMIGGSEDDLKILIMKRFILTFDSGIVVIKHWKIHNYIQNDRFKETTYLEEKATLMLDGKKAYTEKKDDVYSLDTQVSIGKVSIGKDRIVEDNTTTTTNNHSFIQSEEFALFTKVAKVFGQCRAKSNPEDFIAYNEARGWLGIGGESVLDNLERYVCRWESYEIAKRGNKECELGW